MTFLIITQDLRVSGTSQGIIERSFLAKLRKSYPKALIDVVYLAHSTADDALELLPVDSVKKIVIKRRIPFHVKWINRFSTRVFNYLYAETYQLKDYTKHISALDYAKYDHVFIRSAGLGHETILATYGLPILKHAIVNFHDPYPLTWYVGTKNRVHFIELLRLKKMMAIVEQAKACCSSAHYMSHDLQQLYASKKHFYTLPHQYDASVFDFSDAAQVLKKSKPITITYHGALMFGRNAKNLLQAYSELVSEDEAIKAKTELILRVKGDGVSELKVEFEDVSNIKILKTLNFSNSSNEQIHESDIVIILENGPLYSNILVGKAAFLGAYQKPILCVSPPKSELRNIITDNTYIADMNSAADIKKKLKYLIDDRMSSKALVSPFGTYFSDVAFYESLNHILTANK